MLLKQQRLEEETAKLKRENELLKKHKQLEWEKEELLIENAELKRAYQ